MVGRLPRSLRLDVQTMCVHGGGALPFGGGNNSILVHVDVEPTTVPFLEEILFHEAAHTSYGPEHDAAPGWLAAQQADATFISDYARDNPGREDVAESLLMWYAARHRSDRLDAAAIAATEEAIPNRLSYFDALSFETGELFPRGDFNENYVVDSPDLPFWQAGYGLGAGASHGQGDADDDQDGSANSMAVPEPVTGSSFGVLVYVALIVSRRLRSPQHDIRQRALMPNRRGPHPSQNPNHDAPVTRL